MHVAVKSRLISSLLLCTASLVIGASPALADCVFQAGVGNDAYVCDSGTSLVGLSDLVGDNSLTMPAGGNGVINGTVAFGGGADTITIESGQITGAVSQGSEIDRFFMSGGQIASLQQGDGYDIFEMTGGTIVGGFDDGDYAVMSGGTIGRVDMKLADNFFYLRDGTIRGNLVAGFGRDTIDISGGSVGGNVSVSGGDDIMVLTGGSIGGEIRMSFGNDRLTWGGGGAVFGSVLMGADADLATLRNLTEATLSVTPSIDGGEGADVLVFDGTFAANGARYANWESIDFLNGSSFTLDGRALVLGDAGTLTGSVGIDASSDIQVDGNATIRSFGAGPVNVVNAGTLYLSHGATVATDRLTIAGNYEGRNGSLVLDTVLASDGAASDQLVISGGAATGLTGIGVNNAGGAGAATTQSGIMLVEAANGATTAGNAFALDRAVAAGAFEYLLFQGGVEAGTADNWYLRSSVIVVPTPPTVPPPTPPAPPPPAPEPPVAEPVPEPPPAPPPGEPVEPAPDPGPVAPIDPPVAPPIEPQPIEPQPNFGGATEPTPVTPPFVDPANPNLIAVVAPTSQARLPDASLLPAGATAIPLYRLEAATYAVVPVAALQLGLQTLGTLDERRGSQGYVADKTQPGWLRVFGQNTEHGWSGTVAPVFDGETYGLQAGFDLLALGWEDGSTTTGGLFLGTAGMSGDIRGFALGWDNYDVGTLNLNSTQLGAYLTHTGPTGWYLDGVLVGSWLDGSATSTRGVGIDVSGFGLAASLETGLPIAMQGGWTLEPQGQVIWQNLSLDSTSDAFSDVTFARSSGVSARLGVRLEKAIALENGTVTPAVFANLWQDFGSTETRLGSNGLETRNAGTALEVGVGFTAEIASNVSFFGNASFTTGLGGDDRSASKAQLGLQVKF